MATLKTNTLTGTSTAGSIAVTGEGNSTTTNLQQGLAKSFITFRSDSSFINRDSFNVSSLADGGAGFGTATMTNVMSSIYHTTHSTSNDENAHAGSGSHTTANYQMFSKNSSHSLTDADGQYGTVFGDLA
tara:strand:+ start:700 stop:1089 length:390 start_codon:yes stop_codon:yes gene_type:complete